MIISAHVIHNAALLTWSGTWSRWWWSRAHSCPSLRSPSASGPHQGRSESNAGHSQDLLKENSENNLDELSCKSVILMCKCRVVSIPANQRVTVWISGWLSVSKITKPLKETNPLLPRSKSYCVVAFFTDNHPEIHIVHTGITLCTWPLCCGIPGTDICAVIYLAHLH